VGLVKALMKQYVIFAAMSAISPSMLPVPIVGLATSIPSLALISSKVCGLYAVSHCKDGVFHCPFLWCVTVENPFPEITKFVFQTSGSISLNVDLLARISFRQTGNGEVGMMDRWKVYAAGFSVAGIQVNLGFFMSLDMKV
jgi:hypothetical protein